MKKKLLDFVTHTLFISLILTSVLLYITHPLFPKYKADLIKKEKVHSNNFYYYPDLDNDGYSEEISLDKVVDGRIIIIVKTKGLIIDQWIFKGNFNMSNLFFGDFNNDGLKEIYLFTINQNDILLNCISPFEKKKYLSDKLIDKFYPKNEEKSSGLTFCELADLDNDGKKEFVFSFAAGYSVSPRKLYSYNYINDSLNKTKSGCISLTDITQYNNINDISSYYIASNHAVGNCDTNSLYSDQFTWLTVFDIDLNFKFEPIKIGYYPSDLFVKIINIKNKNFLAVLNINGGNNNNPCSIGFYDINGNRIKEKLFSFNEDLEWAKIIDNDNFDQLFILKKNGNIEILNENLNFEVKYKILPFLQPFYIKFDCDSDKINEFIFHHQTFEKITILRNDFEDPVILDVPGNSNLSNIDVIYKGKIRPQLYLRLDNYSYYYNYYKNPFYNIRFLVYISIYFGIFALLYVLQKAQNYRLQQKFNAQKEISELQMKSIKNQMDPHFTLNIINSIGSLFSKQETEKANYIFGKYSKLLRSTILSSNQIVTTLDEELDYVENYLSLEKFRLKNELKYEIKKDDEINGNIKIPKMLIHTFIENSIKHGIKHLDGNGKISITILNGNDLYKIKITDNGIGQNKAREISTFSTGKGLDILNQILDLYYTLERVKITYEIIDLGIKENDSAGTEVIIEIPIANT